MITLDCLPLRLVAPVPLARHFCGQLLVAEAERKRQSEGDCAEEERESGGHYFGGDPQLLESHEYSENYDPALADACEGWTPMKSAGTRHDQAADETSQHDPDDDDHDGRYHARDVADELAEHIGQ